MSPSQHLKTLTILAFAALASADYASGKRGLCYVPNNDHPGDNKIWIQAGSDLTWYYNYGYEPSSVFSGLEQDEFEFVPMMWGVGNDPKDTTFLNTVRSLIRSGTNISHVLGFNEPDAPYSWGGSNLEPEKAARAWVHNFEPLGQMGVKLGLPAVTGTIDGLPWLKQFLANCSEILSENTGTNQNCTWDFIPVHCYDNFEGLASQIGERHATWPDAEIWITEYAYANQDLQATEETFNTTLDYFDRVPYIERYSYFGAFRSYTSNVGPNVAMLNNKGQLTEIGVEYLGINATGVDPDNGAGGHVGRRWRTLLVSVAWAFAWIVL
ncbi:F5/8 type C domain protein [Thelonectria olida]|uniref:F5/8 type C domain protein n=1 Tax=Thelonectria olida TaxID=1576542 RepID=A0A9P9AQ74_9HYPO|nr:F5/8 type C domain protein [Thelonectria olida]